MPLAYPEYFKASQILCEVADDTSTPNLSYRIPITYKSLKFSSTYSDNTDGSPTGGIMKFQTSILHKVLTIFAAMAPALTQGQVVITPLEDVIPLAVQKRLQTQQVKALRTPFPETPYVDISQHDTPVKTQFGGTCTTFGLVAAMENLFKSTTGETRHLSERHSWSKYKKYSVYSAISALTNSGVVQEEWWPQANRRPYAGYTNEWWTKLAKTTYFEDDIGGALQALEAGRPVYLGMSNPADMLECRETIRPTSPVAKGGHAVAVVGYKLDPQIPGGGYFLIKNSWGDKCGRQGYQWFPFNHCLKTQQGGYCLLWSIDQLAEH